ncbi:hypothetical protein V8E36_007530 [Tilletia maclaganii]
MPTFRAGGFASGRQTRPKKLKTGQRSLLDFVSTTAQDDVPLADGQVLISSITRAAKVDAQSPLPLSSSARLRMVIQVAAGDTLSAVMLMVAINQLAWNTGGIPLLQNRLKSTVAPGDLSEWATKAVRHNIHVLYPDVGRLLVFYLAMLRPTFDCLWRMRHGADRNYVWCSFTTKTARKTQKWDTTIIGRELQNLSASIMGLELSISANRHFAEAIAHEKFRTGGMR